MDEQRTRLTLYISYLITQIGSWAFRIGILVGLLQESVGAVGIGVAVIFAPIIIGSLFISPIVDKVDRLKAMIVINSLRIAALVPLFFLTDISSPETFLSIAFLSLLQPVYMSAQVSFLRGITTQEDIVSVLRNITNIEWFTYVIGMSLGAILISQLSLEVVLAFSICALMISIGIITFAKYQNRNHYREIARHKSGTIYDLKPLFPSFLAVFLLNLGAGIINIYPAVRSTVDNVTDQRVLTIIVVANGVFGLLGALSVKPIYDRLGALPTMAGAALFISVSLATMALDKGLVLAVASSSAMLGLGQIFAVSAQTHLVASVPEERAGQLSGLFQCCTFGGVAANGVLFSVAGSALNFSTVLFLCSASAFAALGIAWLASATDRARHSSL